MVATRRGARSALADSQPFVDDPEASLRKKSSRKPNASQNSTASTVTQPETTNHAKGRGRTTRTKAITEQEVEPEPSQSVTGYSDHDASTLETQPPATATQSTNKRKRAAEEVVDEEKSDLPPVKRATRSTRAVTQVDIHNDTAPETEELAANAPSQTRAMRGRRTKGTKAKDNSDTQETLKADETQTTETVSTSRARLGRAKVTAKEAPPSKPVKAATRKAPTKTTRSKPSRNTQPLLPSSSPASSSPLTSLSESSLVEFEQPKDYTEDKRDAQVDESSDDDDLLQEHVIESSEDELAGKVTPMKRRDARSVKAYSQTLDSPDELAFETPSAGIDESTMFQDVLSDDEESAIEPKPGGTVQIEALHTSVSTEKDVDEIQEESLLLDTIPDIQPPDTLDENVLDLDEPTNTTDDVGDNDDPHATELLEEPATPESASDRSVIHTEVEEQDEVAADDESDMLDVDDEDEYTQLSLTAKTPRPQTIDWESIQPNTVVRQNLAMPASPHVDEDQLGIMPDRLSSPTKREIVAQVQHISEMDEQPVEFTDFVAADVTVDLSPLGPSESSLPMQSMEDDANDVFGEDIPEQELRDTPPEGDIPHYMHSTIAFDARRKSLPSRASQTPVKIGPRPKTSDGASNDSHQQSYDEPWWLKARSTLNKVPTTTSPAQVRRNIAPFASSLRHPATPSTMPARVRLAREHASTVAVPSRYKRTIATPTKSASKPSARELLAKTMGTPGRSPARTPLRTLMGISSVSSMTPHPTVPLRGVVAIVEVYTLEGASASAPFVAQLNRLGAKTTKIWGDRITHVVYKDGPPATLQRVLLHNKKVLEKGSGTHIHCVNSRWVSDCDTHSARVMETDEAYAVNTRDLSVARRKRKSMEPSTVVNIDGSLIRHRNSSWGRSVSGRLLGSPLVGSPRVPSGDSVGKENSASPATSAADKPTQSISRHNRKLESNGAPQFTPRQRSFWKGAS